MRALPCSFTRELAVALSRHGVDCHGTCWISFLMLVLMWMVCFWHWVFTTYAAQGEKIRVAVQCVHAVLVRGAG